MSKQARVVVARHHPVGGTGSTADDKRSADRRTRDRVNRINMFAHNDVIDDAAVLIFFFFRARKFEHGDVITRCARVTQHASHHHVSVSFASVPSNAIRDCSRSTRDQR